MSLWISTPIAAPWRQGLCGSITAAVVVAAVWLPTPAARPDDPHDAPPARAARPAANEVARRPDTPSHMTVFTVARPDLPDRTTRSSATHATAQLRPAPSPESQVSAISFRMADGDTFPLVITIPAGPAWREVFRRYGGAIGVSNSSSPRPAYLNHTISPDGRVDEESVPTVGRFLFKLSDEAIRVVNDDVEPTARIPPGQSAFGVFAGAFRSVVARVLQQFCTTEHVNPDDLAGVQLELAPEVGLRVASTTRRAKKL